MVSGRRLEFRARNSRVLRFLGLVDGAVFNSGIRTCISGRGHELDYYVLGSGLAAGGAEVCVRHDIPTTPHWPVTVRINSSVRAELIWSNGNPKEFPPRLSIGPWRAPLVVSDWAWESGRPPPDAGMARAEWVKRAGK